MEQGEAMIPVVSIIGHHDAGKTRLLSSLIAEFADRGLRIGAAKHAPHLDLVEADDTDSQRLYSAGAGRVLLLARDAAMLTTPLPADNGLPEAMERAFSDACDLILAEGFKSGPFPKIEVFRQTGRIPQQPLAGTIDVAAVITDVAVGLPDGIPHFSPHNIPGIADFIEQQFFTT
jgi:molybdopterin-guanine dinucleotide biosynthesis protein B